MPQVQCDMRVEYGEPKHVLVDLSGQQPEGSVLIVGSHGKTGSDRELGSVSDYCMRFAVVPVLIVKDPTHLKQLRAKSGER